MTEIIPAWLDDELKPVDKMEVHRRGLFHPAVSVFVFQGDLMLAQRRALGKYHTPGLWANTCCTHPRWGEAPEDCARRRLSEELGISGLDLRAGGEIEYRAEVGGGMVEHEKARLFIAEAPEALEIRPTPTEVMAVRWITLATLRDEIAVRPEDFTPWLRIYLAEHAARIFGGVA